MARHVRALRSVKVGQNFQTILACTIQLLQMTRTVAADIVLRNIAIYKHLPTTDLAR